MPEVKASWTIYDKEQPLAYENVEFTICLSTTLVCTQDNIDPKEDSLYGMAEEDVHHCTNEEMDQEHGDCIERWFQAIITSKHHYLLQQLLVSYHFKLLVFDAHVHIKDYISNLSMNVFVVYYEHGCSRSIPTLEGDLLHFFK